MQQQISLIQFLHFILLFKNSSLLLQLSIERLHSEHTIFSATLLLYSNIYKNKDYYYNKINHSNVCNSLEMYEGTSNTDKGSKRGVQYTDSSFLYLVFIIRTYFKWGWELLRNKNESYNKKKKVI